MSTFDDAWLQAYLRMHPDLAARMGVRPGTLPEAMRPGEGGDEPEGVLLGKIRRCAMDNGFLFYHTFDSRGSELGYLDCTLTKPGHPLYIWELKDRRRKATEEQLQWLAFLPQATHIEAALYRPADWPVIEALLRRRTP